jgi:hypothetical protein
MTRDTYEHRWIVQILPCTGLVAANWVDDGRDGPVSVETDRIIVLALVDEWRSSRMRESEPPDDCTVERVVLPMIAVDDGIDFADSFSSFFGIVPEQRTERENEHLLESARQSQRLYYAVQDRRKREAAVPQ